MQSWYYKVERQNVSDDKRRIHIMQKTKLGISVGLLGAAVYLSGMLSIVALVILAGYILLMEENEWLRKAAIKAVAIVLAFTVLNGCLGLINDVLGIINSIIGWFGSMFTLRIPLNIESIISYAFEFVETALLILLGISSLSQGSVKVDILDKLIAKHTENQK